jgi:fumarate reductase flavoprotein subunit
MMRQRGRYVYAVFDELNVRHWMEHGLDIARGLVRRPGARLDISGALKQALADSAHDLWAAPSIAELAPKIGIDPAVLKATVEEYNGFCAKGHDDLFGKDPQYLRPLTEPVYYALKCNMFFLGTLGGIKVNRRMEVVDRKDNSIPGLYAGGLDADGFWKDSYDVAICGGTLTLAVNSGRIAGKSALGYLGREAVREGS